ncbi:HAD family phosphatase [Aquimarina sp. U1-2]|uniref:HAD family hydrolase n=1 Tax=Aquimarina sp. U1-2 TaxID=2823141 RepID=UPI001AEC85E5|nr:HAD family phosphatase [Aquimarina sp. U1-2]MBP2833920.1 HAD family phosphatase [Aquimarina sp. U1-2]
MIKTIIFDFGDVFINLDKNAIFKELSALGIFDFNAELQELNTLYETGKITTATFLDHYQTLFPEASKTALIQAWNAILLDFPRYRLDFLEKLSAKQHYQLILLSNTNELHIKAIKETVPFYETFKSCFDAFYLSHEIQLRKPNADIFRFVLEQHQIQPHETLFIDDTPENTIAAAQLGIHTWNNDPKTQDIINLFTIKSHLF